MRFLYMVSDSGKIARLRGQHRKDSIERVLFLMGLEQTASKTFQKFSLGMKQRLGIAAALIRSDWDL